MLNCVSSLGLQDFVDLLLLLFLQQSSSKGDTVEVLKKQLQEKESQILEGMWS